MDLHEFPRPPQDNGRGVHWSLSVYEWGKKNWAFWREQLQAMNLKWVKVMDDGGGSGLLLARQLIDIEIMPIIRFYRPEQNPGTIGQRGREAARRYVQAGAMYFETNNEPDLELEWRHGHRPDNWLDIVVDDFIVDADIILEEGGYPAMPAFGVGTQRNPFQKMVERGRRDILDGGAWAAIHNYCLARPLEYPNDPVNLRGESIDEAQWHASGGMWAWEMGWDAVNQARQETANPDASIMTDATCFRGFEYLNAIIVQTIGHSIPIMMTEGGYNVGQRAGTTYGDDPRYPKPTPQIASSMNLEMFRYMQGGRTILGHTVPDYFFAVMPWLIAAYRIGVFAPPAENQGPWFTHQYDQDFNLNGELPLVTMLKDHLSQERQDGPVPPQWTKPYYHQELGRNWDCRLNYLGVKLEAPASTEGPYWKVTKARWLDEDEALGASYMFIRVHDADGNPMEGVSFRVRRSDGSDVAVTKGPVDGYWGNYAMYATLGTYQLDIVQDDLPSETITGIGLGREDDHDLWTRTAFRFIFQLVNVPREAGEEHGLANEEEKIRALEKVTLETAKPHIIPLDPHTAFHQYARQNELGERISVEFTFQHDLVDYTAQAFEKAVIYAPTRHPNDIKHVTYSA